MGRKEEGTLFFFLIYIVSVIAIVALPLWTWLIVWASSLTMFFIVSYILGKWENLRKKNRR
jgi:hypothetical protein